MKRLWLLFSLAGMSLGSNADEDATAILVFKGVQKKEGVWVLWFADKKNVSYFFNALKSNTEPYVFFTTGLDGGLKENDKIKRSWFVVRYSIGKYSRKTEKIITQIILRK